jgi:two-component system, NarL family, response regulator NreC
MPEARILVADDHSIVRKGLRSILEDEASFEIVGEASNGREAVKLCEAEQPDVAILDVGMPQLNGIEVVVHLQKVSPRTKALMLSMHCDETYILRALNAGARGYLLKDTAEDEVVPAIRNLMRGASYFSPAIGHAFSEEYLRHLRKRGLQDSYDTLTDREREVLQLLAEGRSNKEVASMLDVGVSTVDTHRMNLMQKLNLHSTAEIVLYAVRKKLIT